MFEAAPIEPIRFFGNWDSARHMYRNYPLGVDAVFDRFQRADALGRIYNQTVYLPLYFGFTGQGWTIRDSQGEMAAILYLRRHDKRGVRILHVDDIEVAEAYRRRGLAQKLLAFAEQTARTEQRPFLTLAVTVANTPAANLYRRLGYQDQHHRFFVPTVGWFNRNAPGFVAENAAHITVAALDRRTADKNRDTIYRAEVERSNPTFAPVLIAHYPPTPPRTLFKIGGDTEYFGLRYDGRAVGHVDIFRNYDSARVRVGLLPDLWASEMECAATRATLDYLRRSGIRDFTYTVLSIGHHSAIRESLAPDFGLCETTAERMLMIKPLSMTD